MVLQKIGITFRSQLIDASDLGQWWMEQLLGRTKMEARSLNLVVTLVWWSIWKERNARVFNNLHSTPVALFNKIVDEAAVWLFAGRSLAGQLAHRPRGTD
jgi:hypothetical protein